MCKTICCSAMLSRRRCCLISLIAIVIAFIFLSWDQYLPSSDEIHSSKGVDVVARLTASEFKKFFEVKFQSSHVDLSQNLVYRFPVIMIIGFGKSGTKALYEALKLHPKLDGPYKEKRFFSEHYASGLKSYLNSFPDPPVGGYTLEKSPDYIVNLEAAQRIKKVTNQLKLEGKMRFIVVLRDPIDRAMSEYLEWNSQRKLSKKEKLPPFHKMVTDEHGHIKAQPFLNTSCYAFHIRNWLNLFSKYQFCFVDGNKFVLNPFNEIHSLESCLGLEHYFTKDSFVYEAKRQFYCFRKSQNTNATVCMNKSKGRKHPLIPRDVNDKLVEYFNPWNKQLLELTGRSII